MIDANDLYKMMLDNAKCHFPYNLPRETFDLFRPIIRGISLVTASAINAEIEKLRQDLK